MRRADRLSESVGGRVPHARLVWEAAEPGDYLIWARPLAGRATAAANFDATLVVSGEEPREFRGTVEAGGEDVLIFDFSVKHQHTPTSPGYASPTASSRAREESVRSLADDFEPEPRDARIISSRRIVDEEPERVVSRRYEDDGYSYRPARPTYQVNLRRPAWPDALCRDSFCFSSSLVLVVQTRRVVSPRSRSSRLSLSPRAERPRYGPRRGRRGRSRSRSASRSPRRALPVRHQPSFQILASKFWTSLARSFGGVQS